MAFPAGLPAQQPFVSYVIYWSVGLPEAPLEVSSSGAFSSTSLHDHRSWSR